MAKYINKTINMIYGRSMANGRVSLYPNGVRGDDFLLLYTFEFLTDAKEAGFSVNRDFYEKTRRTLKSSLSSFSDLYRAYGVYLLTKSQMIPGALLADSELALKETIKKAKLYF